MDKPCEVAQEQPETINIPAWKQVYAEHFAQHNNKTKAYQYAKPHVSPTTARKEGSACSTDPDIIKLVNEAINKRVDKKRYSKEAIMDNIDVIRKKTLNKQQYSTSLKANKELAELGNLYERGADDPGQYRTLIQSLVVHNTTRYSGQPPKQVESEVDAEFEDVQHLDNIEDNE